MQARPTRAPVGGLAHDVVAGEDLKACAQVRRAASRSTIPLAVSLDPSGGQPRTPECRISEVPRAADRQASRYARSVRMSTYQFCQACVPPPPPSAVPGGPGGSLRAGPPAGRRRAASMLKHAFRCVTGVRCL
jgi:hypothetical protein